MALGSIRDISIRRHRDSRYPPVDGPRNSQTQARHPCMRHLVFGHHHHRDGGRSSPSPNHNMSIVRAMRKTLNPRVASPTFDDPRKWTNNLLDFLSQCLQKDNTKRPSAYQLLSHPFLKGVFENKTLRQKMLRTLTNLKHLRSGTTVDAPRTAPVADKKKKENSDIAVHNTGTNQVNKRPTKIRSRSRPQNEKNSKVLRRAKTEQVLRFVRSPFSQKKDKEVKEVKDNKVDYRLEKDNKTEKDPFKNEYKPEKENKPKKDFKDRPERDSKVDLRVETEKEPKTEKDGKTEKETRGDFKNSSEKDESSFKSRSTSTTSLPEIKINKDIHKNKTTKTDTSHKTKGSEEKKVWLVKQRRKLINRQSVSYAGAAKFDIFATPPPKVKTPSIDNQSLGHGKYKNSPPIVKKVSKSKNLSNSGEENPAPLAASSAPVDKKKHRQKRHSQSYIVKSVWWTQNGYESHAGEDKTLLSEKILKKKKSIFYFFTKIYNT